MSTMTPQDIAQLSGRDLSLAICDKVYSWQWATEEYVDVSSYAFAEDDALAFQAADKVGLFEKGYFLYAALDSANVLLWCVVSLGALADSVLGLSDDIANLATGATRAEAVCRAALLLAMEGK